MQVLRVFNLYIVVSTLEMTRWWTLSSLRQRGKPTRRSHWRLRRAFLVARSLRRKEDKTVHVCNDHELNSEDKEYQDISQDAKDIVVKEQRNLEAHEIPMITDRA